MFAGRRGASANAEACTRKVMYHLQVSFWRRRRVTDLELVDLKDRAMRTSRRLTAYRIGAIVGVLGAGLGLVWWLA